MHGRNDDADCIDRTDELPIVAGIGNPVFLRDPFSGFPVRIADADNVNP